MYNRMFFFTWLGYYEQSYVRIMMISKPLLMLGLPNLNQKPFSQSLFYCDKYMYGSQILKS